LREQKSKRGRLTRQFSNEGNYLMWANCTVEEADLVPKKKKRRG